MKEVIYQRFVAQELRDDEGGPAVKVAITREVNFILVHVQDVMTSTVVIANFHTFESSRAIEWLFSTEGSAAIQKAVTQIKLWRAK